MTARIDTITIQEALPEVFAREPSEANRSDVWLQPDVTLLRPQAYLIAAASGTGKTSLVSYLYGSRTDYQGRILFNGEDVGGFSIDRWCEIRRCHLALLPQELHLFGDLTALENIEVKNRLTHHKTRAQIMEMLEALGIAHKASQKARLLSLGQQQRVAAVRALCQPFDYILLDEPVSHLDEANNLILAQMITAEAHAQQASVVATSVGNNLSLNQFNVLRL